MDVLNEWPASVVQLSVYAAAALFCILLLARNRAEDKQAITTLLFKLAVIYGLAYLSYTHTANEALREYKTAFVLSVGALVAGFPFFRSFAQHAASMEREVGVKSRWLQLRLGLYLTAIAVTLCWWLFSWWWSHQQAL